MTVKFLPADYPNSSKEMTVKRVTRLFGQGNYLLLKQHDQYYAYLITGKLRVEAD